MLPSIFRLAHLLASGIAAPLGKTEVLSVPLTDVAQADEGRFVYGFVHPTGRDCNSSGFGKVFVLPVSLTAKGSPLSQAWMRAEVQVAVTDSRPVACRGMQRMFLPSVAIPAKHLAAHVRVFYIAFLKNFCLCLALRGA